MGHGVTASHKQLVKNAPSVLFCLLADIRACQYSCGVRSRGATMNSRVFAKLFALTTLATFAVPVSGQALDVPVVSDSSWTVFDNSPTPNNLGNAQYVCL